MYTVNVNPSKLPAITEWPEVMPELTANNFKHGEWVSHELERYIDKYAEEIRCVSLTVDLLKKQAEDYTLSYTEQLAYSKQAAKLDDQLQKLHKKVKPWLDKLSVCGTPRCAVGNVLSAFRLDPRSSAWQSSPLEEQVRDGEGPVSEFVTKFAKNLGANIPAKTAITLWNLSDLFEHGYLKLDDNTIIKLSRIPTAKQSATAFNKTVRECGFTEVTKYE